MIPPAAEEDSDVPFWDPQPRPALCPAVWAAPTVRAGHHLEETAHELGALLEKHVRFEERVLFPRAEVLLSERELASVRDAGVEPEAGRAPR